MGDEKRYLVVAKLGSSNPERLIELVPAFQKALSKLSSVTIEQAIRSATADVFGYFIKSRLKAAQIVAAIESPGTSYVKIEEPFLSREDALFVMEVGSDFHASSGFTRAATWLQRH